MGNGIAHVFARAGYKVLLRDVERSLLDRAMQTIARNLEREVKNSSLPAPNGTKLWRVLNQEKPAPVWRCAISSSKPLLKNSR